MPDDHSYTDDDGIRDDRIDDDEGIRGDDYDDEYRGPTDMADDDTVGHREYVESVYGEDDDAVDEDAGYGNDDYDTGYAATDEDGGWLSGSLGALLLVAGVVLFFFPEPITSTVGIGLIVLGILTLVAAALA